MASFKPEILFGWSDSNQKKDKPTQNNKRMNAGIQK